MGYRRDKIKCHDCNSPPPPKPGDLMPISENEPHENITAQMISDCIDSRDLRPYLPTFSLLGEPDRIFFIKPLKERVDAAAKAMKRWEFAARMREEEDNSESDDSYPVTGVRWVDGKQRYLSANQEHAIRMLPHCYPIHTPLDRRNGIDLWCCPCSSIFSNWRERNNINAFTCSGCNYNPPLHRRDLFEHFDQDGGFHEAVALYLKFLYNPDFNPPTRYSWEKSDAECIDKVGE